MSAEETHMTTGDPDFDYGALIAESDIDEDALLEFDPDAADPDQVDGEIELVAGKVVAEFEGPEVIEEDPVSPEADDEADYGDVEAPEPVDAEADTPDADPVAEVEKLRALDPAGSPIVAVCGLSGGAGTSTFAMLLAYAAAQQKRGPVLLADLGGPSASMAAYLSKRAAHSLASAANSHRAGLFGADGKPPFAELSNDLRLMAREPGLADDELSSSADPFLYDLLVDAQEDHFATVVDCGRLEQLSEVAVAEHATHIVWVVSGEPAPARRARAALKSLPFRGSKSSILVVRTDDQAPLSDRTATDIRHAADSADADIILCSDAGDVVAQGIARTATRAILPVKAALGRILK